MVELDSKLGEAGAVKSHLEQASSVITQLQSQLKAERERMTQMEKARDEAVKDQKQVSFALKDEIEKNAALSNQLLKLQKGFDAAQQVVAETTQQLQAARNEAHHLQSALAHTQVCKENPTSRLQRVALRDQLVIVQFTFSYPVE